MRERVYKTKRQWHNLSAWLWMVPFMILITLLLGLSLNNFLPMFIALGVGVVGAVVALVRDLGVHSVYRIEAERLVLQNPKGQLVVPREEMIDASLIDRTGAREYILQKSRKVAEKEGKATADRMVADFVRYCSVDIGLRSLSFGLGRRMIDRMPKAKHDLLLLRLSTGQDLLLSPLYNQDLLSGISKLLRHH